MFLLPLLAGWKPNASRGEASEERPARRGQRSDAAGRLVTAQNIQTPSVWALSGQFEVQHVGAGRGWRLRAPGSVST